MTGEKQPAAGPEQWLAVRLGRLGDVALTTGVLAWLGESRGWNFDVLTSSSFAEIFTGHPNVRQVLSLDTRQNALALGRNFLTLRAARRGWGLLDLHGNTRSRLLAALWQGPVARYRKMALARRLLLARGRLSLNSLRSALAGLSVPQRYALAVASSPPESSLVRPRILLAPEETREAGNLLKSLFRGERRRPVALHPYAAHQLKAWPQEYYRELIRILDARKEPWICIGRGTALFPDRAEDLTNRTSLRQTCALLSLCRCLVTGDSGPMHLASAVGSPVLGLFGPTTREWGFYPAGAGDRIL
ncbi:MAG: glycosyltransferase family 9 protein, partial [Desulfovibrio sp.]|nr:glycosyltransferase family 9 protein [Desulfovibrio sp.]